jgi:RHS repeat-associated protein
LLAGEHKQRLGRGRNRAGAYKYKYNGKELQDELGLNLYAYGYRHYDPAIGRWTTMDPLLNDLKFSFDDNKVDEDDENEVYQALITKLETAEGIYNTNNLNPYGYGYNDPVSFDDPDGRCPWCIVVLAVYLLTPETAVAPTGNWKKDGKAVGESKAMKGNILLSVGGAGLATKIASSSKSTPAKEKAVEKVTEKAKQGSKDGPSAGKKFTPKQKAEAVKENAEKNGGQTKCETCGTKTSPAKKSEKGVSPPKDETQVDHIYPRSQGGNTTKENTQILCRDCNIQKSDKLPGQ